MIALRERAREGETLHLCFSSPVPYRVSTCQTTDNVSSLEFEPRDPWIPRGPTDSTSSRFTNVTVVIPHLLQFFHYGFQFSDDYRIAFNNNVSNFPEHTVLKDSVFVSFLLLLFSWVDGDAMCGKWVSGFRSSSIRVTCFCFS